MRQAGAVREAIPLSGFKEQCRTPPRHVFFGVRLRGPSINRELLFRRAFSSYKFWSASFSNFSTRSPSPWYTDVPILTEIGGSS